jgi:hypothetical protein
VTGPPDIRPRSGVDDDVGAWGIRLPGIGAAAKLLVRAPHEWPELHVTVRQGDPTTHEQHLNADSASFPLTGGGTAELSRADGSAVLTLPTLPTADTLIHPYLAPVVTIANQWWGRDSFHAGGVVVDGRAWGILGGRGAGKSSLLAWCALQGMPVVTDDVLVLDGLRAMAGPRCIDLRSDVAAHLGVGRELGQVRDRERWRLDLDPVPAEVPLAGWLLLRWADTVSIERVPADEFLPLLIAQKGVNLPSDPRLILDLLALPTLHFSRPRAWSDTGAALDLLVGSLASVPGCARP